MSAFIKLRGLWWLLTAVLAALLLRIWHAVLMKEDLDRPIVLCGWIVGAWALIAAARVCERRGLRTGVARTPLVWSARTPAFWVLLAVFSGLLVLFHLGFQRAVGDGRGYFAQLNSLVIDRDLDFRNNITSFGARRADAAYPLGTALLWSPFFLLAHFWLGLLNLLGADYPRDGYWNPYQRAIGLGTLTYGFAAMVMTWHLLRRHFDGPSSGVAAVTILLSTPVVWYLAVDSSMSHGVSLFAATAFLAACLTTHGRRTPAQWVRVGALAALMIYVRPQNALFLGVLAVEGVLAIWHEWRTHADPWRLLRAMLPYAIPLLVVLVIAWFMVGPPTRGRGTPYVLRMGLLARPRFMEQLFSANHGLVSSSPVLAIALLGLPLVLRKDVAVALGLLAVAAAQIFVNGTSSNWNAGASFGARRFVECAPIFAFGLAAAVDLARRRPLVPIGLVAGTLVAVNLAVVDDVRRGILNLSASFTAARMAESVVSRVGNPASLPAALLFAWQHDVPVSQFDRMRDMVNLLRIDIGSEADEGYLVGRWMDRERDSRHVYRWVSDAEAVVVARLRQGAYTLRFRAEPFVWRDAPRQTVEIRIGRTLVATRELARGYRDYEVIVPEALTPRGAVMRLSFRFGHAQSPSEAGMSGDRRRLAARFAWIEMVPRATGP
jgi:hypothetical protein